MLEKGKFIVTFSFCFSREEVPREARQTCEKVYEVPLVPLFEKQVLKIFGCLRGGWNSTAVDCPFARVRCSTVGVRVLLEVKMSMDYSGWMW